MERFRKAVVAGVLAGFGSFATAAVAAYFDNGAGVSSTEWAAILAAAVALALSTGVATYNVRNVGTVNGSDPLI